MDKKEQYRSPLVYQRADPFVFYYDGLYYFTGSIPQYDCIELRCADSLDKLAFANGRVIWRKHDKGEMGAHILAPEIHKIDGKWYIYFTAGEAENIWNIRPYALMCDGEDDVMIYHCRNYKEITGDPLNDPNRHAHAIKFTYDENGLPVFGEPVPDTEI